MYDLLFPCHYQTLSLFHIVSLFLPSFYFILFSLSSVLFRDFLFSWSPRGVFVASRNGAKYLWDGKEIEIPAGGAIESVEPKDLFSGFPLPLEGYPNRNSLSYKEVYGIPEAKTILRGTLRYKVSWCVQSASVGHTHSLTHACMLSDRVSAEC